MQGVEGGEIKLFLASSLNEKTDITPAPSREAPFTPVTRSTSHWLARQNPTSGPKISAITAPATSASKNLSVAGFQFARIPEPIRHGCQDPSRPLWAQKPTFLQHCYRASTVRCRLNLLDKNRQDINVEVSTARNSRPLEVIGTYDPIPKPDPYDDSGKLHKDIKLDTQRARYWIGVGAQPTDTAWRLLSMVGILPKKRFGPKQDKDNGTVKADEVKVK